MSFILDAVKKSEQERRLAQSESLQSWYYQPSRPKEKNMNWVAALVVINSFVLIFLFLILVRPAWLENIVSKAQTVTVSQDSSAAPRTQTSVPAIAASSANSQMNQEVQDFAISEPETIEPSEPVDEIITPTAIQQNKDLKLTPEGEIPDLEQLPESILIHIPAIAFSSHLYSSFPGARQVVVNGQKLREGDYLNQDLQLLAIEEKSVVFQQYQHPFRVYVSRYWVKDE